jgi:hypothetical protein
MDPTDEKLIFYRAQPTRVGRGQASLEYETRAYLCPSGEVIRIEQIYYDFLGSGEAYEQSSVVLTPQELVKILLRASDEVPGFFKGRV